MVETPRGSTITGEKTVMPEAQGNERQGESPIEPEPATGGAAKSSQGQVHDSAPAVQTVRDLVSRGCVVCTPDGKMDFVPGCTSRRARTLISCLFCSGDKEIDLPVTYWTAQELSERYKENPTKAGLCEITKWRFMYVVIVGEVESTGWYISKAGSESRSPIIRMKGASELYSITFLIWSQDVAEIDVLEKGSKVALIGMLSTDPPTEHPIFIERSRMFYKLK
jgi:hypothetical protein